MAEYNGGDSYAAWYVICYFPAMEGLVKLFLMTDERKYLESAFTMADFYQAFNRLPIDHAHGMLSNQVSLLLLYETTGESQYLERVARRWSELVEGGYINPAGGILEKCHVKYERDEGCAIADWQRLNLELARLTGKAKYFAMAERTLHNHFLQNQAMAGGFGHRIIRCDEAGIIGFASRIEESTWCCSFHGQLGFLSLPAHLADLNDGVLTCHFALDFTRTDGSRMVVSELLPATRADGVLRQRLRLNGTPAAILRVRKPLWADAVTAIDAKGKTVDLLGQEGYVATTRPVAEVIFIYKGGVYCENRNCVRLKDGPIPGEACVFGYGPKILATLDRSAARPAWPTSPDGAGDAAG